MEKARSSTPSKHRQRPSLVDGLDDAADDHGFEIVAYNTLILRVVDGVDDVDGLLHPYSKSRAFSSESCGDY